MSNHSLRSLIDSLVAAIECDAQQLHQAALQGSGALAAARPSSGPFGLARGEDQRQAGADRERGAAVDDPVGHGAAAVR